MERLRQAEDFLKLIPQRTLEKLKPYTGRSGEILSRQADFAHLKYHVLDQLAMLRYCDARMVEFANGYYKRVGIRLSVNVRKVRGLSNISGRENLVQNSSTTLSNLSIVT